MAAFLRIVCVVAAVLLPHLARGEDAKVDNGSIVGMTTRAYVDPERRNWTGTGPRPLATTIWYPVDHSTSTETVFDAPAERRYFVPVEVAAAASISARHREYPLIVLSHGTGGSAAMLLWLGSYLARHGYIVAAVNHHGNTAAEPRLEPQGFLLYWERAEDLSRVIDNVLADPVFGSRVDRARIGAAGFSLGGFTVIEIAGGRFNPRAFERFCRSARRDFTCGPQPEFPEAPARFESSKRTDPVVQRSLRRAHDSFRDKRVRAVFAIAPALGGGFTRSDLRDVRIPVEIVVGNADTVTPPATNALRYAALIPTAKAAILDGTIGHYTFLHECTPLGIETLDICRDEPGTRRREVHEMVAKRVLEFFDRTLRRERDGAAASRQ